MNEEERKEILQDIRKERAEAKTKLSIFSSLLKAGTNHEAEINELLDKLSELKEIEEKVRKM